MAAHIAPSASLDWLTPLPIIERVRAALGGIIDLDPCSNQWSRVNARVEYCLPDNDGLKDSWNYPTIFVNPPYGRCHVHKVTREYLCSAQHKLLDKHERKHFESSTILDWVRRCADANRAHGSEVIALIPGNGPETQHWQQVIFTTAAAVCYPRRRIAFDVPAGQSARKAPPMASALVYWGHRVEEFSRVFRDLGIVLRLREQTYLSAA